MADPFLGVRGFYAQFDVSGDMHGLDPALETMIVEHRPWNSNAVRKYAGLANDSARIMGAISYDVAGDPGLRWFNNRGVKVPYSALTNGIAGAEGDRAVFWNALHADYKPKARSGDLLEFEVGLPADGPIILGRCVGVGTKSATGNTASAIQLGAIPATWGIYCNVHAITKTGSPTLDIVVRSDDASSMATPTTRLTMTQLTNLGYEHKNAAFTAGVTDTWWDAQWTFGGTGSLTVAIVIGIAGIG